MNNFVSPTLCCSGVSFTAIPVTDACATVPRLSQITGFIMLPYGAPGPSNWADYTSFSSIIDNEDTTNLKGKIVYCKGELPASTDITAQLGRNTRQYIRKRWEMKAEVPIISDSLFTFLQTIGGCRIGFKLWFTTMGGRLIGGQTGLSLSYVKSDIVLKGGDSDIETGEVVFTWYGSTLGASAEWNDSVISPPISTSFMVFQDLFADSNDGVLIWTQNSGVLPTSNTDAQVWVFKKGVKMQPSEYAITHLTSPTESTITINSASHDAGTTYEVIVIL